MTEDTRKNKTENLQSLLNQIEEYICMGIALKSKVEGILKGNETKPLVKDAAMSGYKTSRTEISLMPDYHIDDNGKVTDIEFTLVKGTQYSI